MILYTLEYYEIFDLKNIKTYHYFFNYFKN